MRLRTRHWLILGTIAALSFLVGSILERSAYRPPEVDVYAQQLEDALRSTENEVEQLFSNGSFLLNAIEGYVSEDTIQKYTSRPYTFIIYNTADSIVYWNNNKALPYQFDIKYDTVSYVKRDEVGNSVYLRFKRPYNVLIDGRSRSYNLECLIPLYKNYSIRNEYVQNYFPLMPPEFSKYVDFSKEDTPFIIHDWHGKPLFYIEAKDDYPYRSYFGWAAGLYMLGSVLAVFMLYLIAQFLARRRGFWKGFGFLFFGLILARFLTIFYDFPSLANEYSLFNVVFASGNVFWLYSLGDFVIDVGLLSIVSLFIQRELKLVYALRLSAFQSIFFLVLTHLVMILGAMLIQYGIRDIILTSYISLEFNDLSNIDGYSMLALLGIGTVLLCYFMVTHQFFRVFNLSKYILRFRLMVFGVLMSLAVIFMVFWQVSLEQILVVTVFCFVHKFLLNLFQRQQHTTFLWISIWLLTFSAFGAVIFSSANIEKNEELRRDYAQQIAFERDIETEKQFDQVAQEILDDGFFEVSLSNPLFLSPQKAVDRITYRYLDNNFFGLYDYTVHIYTDRGSPFKGENMPYRSFEEKMQESQKTMSDYLQFYSNPDGSYSYIARLPITTQNNGNLIAIAVIEMKPKQDFEKSNIYVQLLSRTKKRKERLYAQLKYGLYKYKKRVMTNSDFEPRLSNFMQLPEPGKFKLIRQMPTAETPDLTFVCYRGLDNPDNVSFVRLPRYDISQLFFIFAYIFSFGVALLVVILGVNYLSSFVLGKAILDFNFAQSLRERIQRGIITVTLLSFVAIAIVSIRQFSVEYQDYHQERLKRKINSTAKTATWKIQQSPDSLVQLPSAKSLSKIHRIDVNIFDTDGNLLSSSEPIIYDRHLVSRQMNPMAYYTMKVKALNYYTQDEQINNFSYLAAYVPLKSKEGKTIAFLNLPYDITGTNVGAQDVAKFLGALLNVYVLFLLLAGAIALLIANTITRPLSLIGEKLRGIKLDQKNEPIAWENKDEIGELVDRYNQMIAELEKSTQKLARSQRESAWRDMAKQVAHEIKNPLTPMKLNIQFLQRVIGMNPEKAEKMINRVSSTLIEQIDGLAHIASEFSNFAKMPQAQNEVLNLNELVRNVYNLFKEDDHIDWTLNMTDVPCKVFADKKQMTRVLNNLTKNAVQAIPEDEHGAVSIKLYCTSKTVFVSVQDNGCGIPDEQKDEIFIPNFTTKSSGTGIGLSMSKNIVEMAGGIIYFESEVEKGTTFFVELPRYNTPPISPSSENA